MSQVDYSQQSKARDGLKGNLAIAKVSSYSAEGEIGFGRYCVLGTDKEKQVKLPGLAADITALVSKRGVALQVHTKENLANGNAPSYKDKETVSVEEKGEVYVKVEDAVTPLSAVFVRFQGGDEGLFRSDADGGDAAELANARFKEGADAGGFALLELL